MYQHSSYFIKKGGQFILYGLLAYFTYLMCWITAQYIPLSLEAAFLGIKQEEIVMPHYQVAFFTHVYSSLFLLLAGFTQFVRLFRTKWPSIHRFVGKSYLLILSFFAAPSGGILAYYANGGWWSQLAFSLLTISWFWTTIRAYTAIRQNNWQQHEYWMIRSYALTLSAISLRLFKWAIAHAWALPPMDTYRIVAWSWVVNLIIAEIIIFYKKQVYDKYSKTA